MKYCRPGASFFTFCPVGQFSYGCFVWFHSCQWITVVVILLILALRISPHVASVVKDVNTETWGVFPSRKIISQKFQQTRFLQHFEEKLEHTMISTNLNCTTKLGLARAPAAVSRPSLRCLQFADDYIAWFLQGRCRHFTEYSYGTTEHRHNKVPNVFLTPRIFIKYSYLKYSNSYILVNSNLHPVYHYIFWNLSESNNVIVDISILRTLFGTYFISQF